MVRPLKEARDKYEMMKEQADVKKKDVSIFGGTSILNSTHEC